MTENVDISKLIAIARDAASRSYTPYSNRQDGVALLCDDGSVYAGTTAEIANYASSICAGKMALGKAIFDGKRKFIALVVAGNGPDSNYLCGGCRQAFAEFGLDLKVISDQSPDKTVILSSLLPYTFKLET